MPAGGNRPTSVRLEWGAAGVDRDEPTLTVSSGSVTAAAIVTAAAATAETSEAIAATNSVSDRSSTASAASTLFGGPNLLTTDPAAPEAERTHTAASKWGHLLRRRLTLRL